MFLKTPKEFLKIFWPQTFFATDFSEIVMSTQQNSRRGAAARNPVRLLRVQLGKPSRGESLWQQLAPSLNADRTTHYSLHGLDFVSSGNSRSEHCGRSGQCAKAPGRRCGRLAFFCRTYWSRFSCDSGDDNWNCLRHLPGDGLGTLPSPPAFRSAGALRQP